MLCNQHPQILIGIHRQSFSVLITVDWLCGSADLTRLTQVSVGWVGGSDLVRALLNPLNWASSAFTLLETAG